MASMLDVQQEAAASHNWIPRYRLANTVSRRVQYMVSGRSRLACSSCSKSSGLRALVAGLRRMSLAHWNVMASSSTVHDMFMLRRFERLAAVPGVEPERGFKDESAVEASDELVVDGGGARPLPPPPSSLSPSSGTAFALRSVSGSSS